MPCNKSITERLFHVLLGNPSRPMQTIISCYVGCDRKLSYVPEDYAEFKKCVDLLNMIPELRSCLTKENIGSYSKLWFRLVEQWSVIETCVANSNPVLANKTIGIALYGENNVK